MKILFTGGRAPVTLELIRNFGKYDHQVFLAESIKVNLSKKSKYINKEFLVPAPKGNTLEYIDELIKIINKYEIDVLFPTCEEIFYISKYKDKIELECNNIKLVVDQFEKMKLLHDKYQFIMLAKSLKLLAPKTYLITDKDEIRVILARNKIKKCVLKPVFSRFGSRVVIFDKIEQLKDINLNGEQWVLQEYVKGNMICSYAYVKEGKVSFNICYKNELKNKMNVATIFKPFFSREVDVIVKKIAKQLNYSGNISFDYIENDGKYYLIECNPRVTSGIHMMDKNNLAELFFEDNDQEITLAVRQLFLPTLVNGVKGLNIRMIMKSLVIKDVIFNYKDIKPFCYLVPNMMGLYRISKKNKIGFIEASTFDIEWNGD